MRKAKKLLQLSAILISLSLVFNPVIVFARDISDIETEKAQKQKELDDLNSKLKNAEAQLNSAVYRRNSSRNQVEGVKGELAQVEKQLEVNSLKKKQLKEEIKLKTLEKEKIEGEQDIHITKSYISWKTQDESYLIMGSNDVLKNAIYYDYVTEVSEESILGITNELNKLKKTNTKYEKELEELAKEGKALEEKKLALEKQINELNSTVVSSANNVSGLRQKISMVSAEQQAILNMEKQLINQGSVGTLDITTGQIYFSGQGRDAMQGHGVGMSQYGAKGYAQAGKTAEQILKLYYKGVNVEDYPMNSHIWVIFCPSAPTTDDPPCNNGEAPVKKKVSFDDYLGGLGEMPESWPIEARKAQLIGARTYAIKYTNNGSENNPICLTQSCQVNYLKVGGNDNDYFHDGDLDVTTQTKDKVIKYGNDLITAVYSSDNSQGSGTANNDTVWSNVSGVGTPYPYLRSVNDNQHAEKTQWTTWKWRTNGYNMKQINEMIEYAASKGNTHSGNVLNAVGNVTSLGFAKDPSGRVKHVVVSGSKGSMNMAGWYFKAIWNIWISDKKPSGQYDYIYSLTWDMNKK